MARGKRKVYLEFEGKKFTSSDLDREVYAFLKDNHDIKYSDNIDTYVNFHEGMVYSVVDNTTYKIHLNCLNF